MGMTTNEYHKGYQQGCKDSKEYYETRLKADMVTILDKIRAEIEQEYTKFRNKSDMWNERACGLGTALEIIDKYKAEGEG